MKRLVKFAVVSVCGVALAAGFSSVFTEAQAARCICPLYYAPVICDNGKTYSNPCFASCAKAKNCVPTGDI